MYFLVRGFAILAHALFLTGVVFRCISIRLFESAVNFKYHLLAHARGFSSIERTEKGKHGEWETYKKGKQEVGNDMNIK